VSTIRRQSKEDSRLTERGSKPVSLDLLGGETDLHAHTNLAIVPDDLSADRHYRVDGCGKWAAHQADDWFHRSI
jgi:hypothetical protein